MITYWEVRVSHHGYGTKVESVGVPEDAAVEDVLRAAENEYGSNALAVRRSYDQPWREL